MKALLFDADGVIQRPAVDYRQTLMAVLGPRRDEVDRFVHELFAAERRALNGRRSFVEDLAELLTTWGIAGRMADVLGIWTAIETDPTMCAAIATLRSQGIPCYLATNQEAHRGRYMTETLGYRDMFHREYYSHRLGVAKPFAAYFQAILADLELAPQDLLFIDDNKHNVSAAREVGLHAALFTPGSTSGIDTLRAILCGYGIDCQQPREMGSLQLLS